MSIAGGPGPERRSLSRSAGSPGHPVGLREGAPTKPRHVGWCRSTSSHASTGPLRCQELHEASSTAPRVGWNYLRRSALWSSAVDGGRYRVVRPASHDQLCVSFRHRAISSRSWWPCSCQRNIGRSPAGHSARRSGNRQQRPVMPTIPPPTIFRPGSWTLPQHLAGSPCRPDPPITTCSASTPDGARITSQPLHSLRRNSGYRLSA